MKSFPINKLPGRTVQVDAEEWLYFSGTAYLGVVRDPEFQEWVKEGIDRYGLHYGGSPHANIRLDLFDKVEHLFSELTGAEAALVVSSGTLAGQLTMQVLARRGGTFHYAPGVHPALWTERYRPFEGSYGNWVDRMAPLFHSGSASMPEAPIVLLTNAPDSLHVRRYDFSWLEQLPADRPVSVVLDDSHGIGLTGPRGAGIFPTLHVPAHVELIVIASLAKAFGIPGGIVLSSGKTIGEMRSHPFFGGASPPSPAFLHGFIQGQDHYRKAHRNLLRNIQRFRAGTEKTGLFRSLPDYPVFYTPAKDLAGFLAQRQILISSFNYPSPADDALTRVVVNSLHSPEDIVRLTGLIGEYARKAG